MNANELAELIVRECADAMLYCSEFGNCIDYPPTDESK